MPDHAVLDRYAATAADLVSRFEGLSAAEVYAPVAHLLPARPARVVDIGAGTGRDAAWLAAQGHRVLAVEPVRELREAGAAIHPELSWLDDRLPELPGLIARGERFDQAHLVAVWHHLQPAERGPALAAIAAVVEPEALVLVSLRHGPLHDGLVFEADPEELVRLGRAAGLRSVFRTGAESVQATNRAAGITWTWLALQPEGDG